MKRIALALGAAMLLASCGGGSGVLSGSAGGASAPAQDPLAQIATFTIADLQAADAEAVAQGDTIAHNPAQPCYPALIQWVQGLQVGATGITGSLSIKGGISAFQAARGARLKIESAAGDFSLKSIVPVTVRQACSALVLDEQTFLLKLAAIAGGTVATAGVAPAARILPALLPKLP